MDLDQIRIKLKSQVRDQPQDLVSPPIDWPKTQVQRRRGSGSLPLPTEPTRLIHAVETLQHRAASPEAGHPEDQPRVNEAQGTALEAEILQEAAIHIQRLQTLASRINGLSGEQEQLMGEVRAIESRLRLLQPYFQGDAAGAVPLPMIVLDDAVLAWAESNPDTHFTLTYRSAHIPQPEKEAHRLAQHLRGTYGRSSSRWNHSFANLWSDFQIVWQEPSELMSQVWQQLSGLGRQLKPPGSSNAGSAPGGHVSQSSAWAPLAPVDMLLWFGGGVIGRLALNLLLAAFPPLWSLAVAVLTGITAYALYRATLAPRRDFGLAYRVFLVIAGLLIGSQF